VGPADAAPRREPAHREAEIPVVRAFRIRSVRNDLVEVARG